MSPHRTFWGRYDKVIVTSGTVRRPATDAGAPGRVGGGTGGGDQSEDLVASRLTTAHAGVVSDRLAARTMRPDVRENVLGPRPVRSMRANLPGSRPGSRPTRALPLRATARGRDRATLAVRPPRPVAGAPPNGSVSEQSVLLVPGAMFGLKKGSASGFGYDIEYTMKRSARSDGTLADVVSSVASHAT